MRPSVGAETLCPGKRNGDTNDPQASFGLSARLARGRRFYGWRLRFGSKGCCEKFLCKCGFKIDILLVELKIQGTYLTKSRIPPLNKADFRTMIGSVKIPFLNLAVKAYYLVGGLVN